MPVNEGRQAHEHAINALSYLLNEPWSYEVLGLVRYELGQSYAMLKKHLQKGKCVCGDGHEDLKLYKQLLINVHIAISNASLRPVPVVVEELKSYFIQKKASHNCINNSLKKCSMTHDF
nr:hypothetical protein [uncultured Bacillus sp.]